MRWQLVDENGPVLINGQPRFAESETQPEDIVGKGWTWTEAPLPPPPEVEPVYECSMVQAKLALLQMGLLDSINAFMEGQPREIRIRWEYGTRLVSNDPTLVEAATTVGISEQLPALFELAATL
jgi:hypothetical protein